MSGVRGPVDRRIRVLIVRRRLETHAAALVGRATGNRPRWHKNVKARLLLLASGETPESVRAAHALAHRAADIYGETSSVLHSRRAFSDVPDVLVQEWEAVVDEVDQALEIR